MTRGFSMTRALVCASLVVFFAATLFPVPVAAHAPSNMTLLYDWNSQELTVTISHSVADPNTHYIENVTVFKNDVKFTSSLYTSQESSSTASDTFVVPAVDGDVLRVWVECVLGGTRESTTTLSEPAGTGTTTTTTNGGTTNGEFDFIPLSLLIAGVVIVLGVVMVVVRVARRR
ncbi:MAG: hypothetical protein JSW05_07980 [Candidatus Thorarchaeota archaeon]|nr:MAG: hypothetical protein JSW05_07980 [Candidatus Thorarchaeota archaeon]